MAKDLTALGAACERQSSWTHCGIGGFHWRIPTLRYKTKPAEEGQPHPCPLSALGKGGVHLSVICLLSSQPRLQPIPFSVEGTRQCKRGLAPSGDAADEAGRGQLALRCQPGPSKRSRNSWPAVSISPSSVLAGPTPSFANSVQC